jgi:hypothetical protein
MITEVIGLLTKLATRRNFIQRMASASSALGLALFGMGRLAVAGSVGGCCSLCGGVPTCGANPQCNGSWCWSCPHSDGGDHCTVYNCFECYSINPGGDCTTSGCPENNGSYCGCLHTMCNRATNTEKPCL